MSSDQDGNSSVKNQLEDIQNKIALNKATAELIESEKVLTDKIKANNQSEDEKNQIEKQKQLIDAQIALNESKKAQITAMFPKGQSQGAEGTITTTSNFGYATELIAYQLIDKNAGAIADTIDQLPLKGENNPQAKILIVKDLNFAQGAFPLLLIQSLSSNYKQAMSTQLLHNNNALKSAEPTVTQPTPSGVKKEFAAAATLGLLTAIPSIISGGLSFAADVMRFFKGDYNVAGKDFSLDEEAIVAGVAGRLAEKLRATPQKADGTPKPAVQIYNFSTLVSSTVVSDIAELLQVKQSVEASLSNLKSKIAEVPSKKDELKQLQSELNDAKKEKTPDDAAKKKQQDIIDEKFQAVTEKTNSLNVLSSKLEAINKLVNDSESLLKSFDAFFASISASSENKPSLLVEAMLRKYIETEQITHLLHIKICSKGGEAMTIKKPLSVGGGDTAYISGIVISYILAKLNGEIESAGTFSELASLNYKLGQDKVGAEMPKIKTILKENSAQAPAASDPKKHSWGK